jgi:hypothetical protein
MRRPTATADPAEDGAVGDSPGRSPALRRVSGITEPRSPVAPRDAAGTAHAFDIRRLRLLRFGAPNKDYGGPASADDPVRLQLQVSL